MADPLNQLCPVEGCTRPAKFVAKICVPATGWPRDETKALSAVFGAVCCASHWPPIDVAATFAMEPIPGQPGLRPVFEAMARMAGSSIPPDFDRAWLVRLSIAGDEYRTFARVTGGL